MGASFLPSEVARLVLGYLLDENCIKAYNELFNASKHLEECRGRGFFTKIMGMSLIQILDDYCAVQFLVTSTNCANDFKKAIDKCSTLAGKVKVLIKLADTARAQQPDSNINKAIIHVTESPILNNYKVLDLSTKGSYLRTHSRRNSCDSMVTIRTEKSHKCCLHSKKDVKKCRKDDYVRSVENPIEGTNLADLPGHKDDFDGRDGPSKGKEHIFNDFLNSIDIQSRPLKSQRKELSKSFDSGLDAIKPHLDDNGIDFRHALGLVKHGDIPDKVSKTPIKRKLIKTRGCFSARKLNHTEKNESLDVTVIANAFLDFPELHEKLADNINKLFSSSLNKTELIVNSPFAIRDGQDVSTPKDLKKFHESSAFDDDSQQIESVIKSIVEKTEKDPMFDQLVNEVLATSRGNFSGSESDVLSRPETSTPDKSFNSLSNACSPTSSIFSFEDSNNKFSCDNVAKRKLRSWKPPKVECLQDKSYFKEKAVHVLNMSMKITKSDPKCTPSNSETRYPRRPRGGKKMDVLKANYERTSIEENELDPKDISLCIQSNEERLSQVDNINTFPIVPEQKIIILSNERVHTNILSNNGSIIIRDPKSNADENIKPLHIPCSNQANIFNPNLGTEIVVHQDTTNIINNQHVPMPVPTFKKSSSNLMIQSGKVISSDNISPDSNFQKLLGVEPEFSQLSCIDSMNKSHLRESASTSTKIIMNFNEEIKNLQNLRGYRHKISDESCTTTMNQTVNSQALKGFTEAEIMKMPTIIMVKEMNNKIDMKSTTLAEDFYGDVAFDKNNDSNFINIIPKVQTLNEFGLLDPGCNVEKPNIDIKIFDAKGLDVFPSESSTTMAEANATVPYIIQSEMNINSVVDVLEHGNLVIDDGKRDESEPNCTYGKLIAHDDRNNIVTLDLKLGSNSDACNSNLKTPDVGNNLKKKLCSSTPTKKNSHIRVLDFNTPEKSEVNNKRKALTSPKQMVPNKSRIQRFNRIGKKFSSNPTEQSSKTRLFNTIVEENSVCVNKCAIETTSVSNSEISEVCKANLNKENIGLQDNNDVTVALSVNVNQLKQSKMKKSVSSWDKDLRATAVSNNPPDEAILKNKRKHVKKSIGKSRKNGSIKVQAKMLEDALLDKSLESVTGAESKLNVSGDGKEIHDENKPGVKSNDCKLSESYVLSTVIEDLELSTNTTIDEGQRDQTLKLHTSEQSCKKVFEVPNCSDNNVTSKASSHSDLMKNEKNYKKNVDLIKECSVLLGINKNKKTLKTKSTFKVKILSKANVDGHSKKFDGSNPVTFKTNKNEPPLKTTIITPKSVLNDSKLSEMDIPDSSHITPELPRECRSNPINIKCNLNSLLETPIKTDILDITMATPRFLSPVHNAEPISAVKMLGMPTPIFGNTPIVSTSKATRLASTPDSSKKGYSSSSSYYMPDEVEKRKEPPVVVSKKKLASNSKSIIKNTSPLNKSSRILRPRRSNRVNMFSKKGSPLQKTKTTNKKPKVISNAKNKTGKHLDSSQNSKSQSSISLSLSDEFSDLEESPIKKPIKSSKNKAKTVEAIENTVPTTSNTKRKNPLESELLEVNIKRSELEEKRLRVLAKCNAEMKIAPTKKKPFSKNMSKNQPFFKFTPAPLSNEERLKKLNVKVTKCQSVTFMSSPQVSDKFPPPKSDDKLNKRKSFTPRKLESKQCETNMSREDATPHLLNSSLKSYKSCIDLSNTEVGRTFTTNAFEPVEVSASTLASCNNDTHMEHQKSENSPDKQTNDISNPFNDKTDVKNDPIKEIVEAPKDIEKNTSSTDASICSTETVDQLCIGENIVTAEKSSSEVQSDDAIKKNDIDDCGIPYTESSSANVEQSLPHETSGDTSSTDLNEPCVDIEWSKSDGTCLHMTYDTTQKSKRKAAKLQDKFDLDNLEINVEIFDTAIDDMRMISLKVSKHICLLDMAPNPKWKKASETVKVTRTKKQTKVRDKPKSNLLQLLIDEMSNSTTESLSPIKSFEAVNNVVYEVDSCYPDSETINAVKAILPENSPLYSHSVAAGSNQTDILDLKEANPQFEVVEVNDLSDRCVDSDECDEPLHMITIDGEKVTKDSKACVSNLEKRKREDEDGQEIKKSKSETINIDTKFDIESVLRHLHGY